MKYLNINVTEEDIDRKPDIIRLYDGESGKSIEYEPIRPKGKWIPSQYSIEWKSDAKCSNCKNLVAGALGHYVTCPYCSADMR